MVCVLLMWNVYVSISCAFVAASSFEIFFSAVGKENDAATSENPKKENENEKMLHGFHSLNAIEGDFIKTKPRYIEQLMNLIVNVETDQHHLLCKLRKKNVKRKKSPKVQKKIVQIAVDMT